MSATVGTNFLETRDRRDAGLGTPRPLEIDPVADGQHPAARIRLEAQRRIAMFEPKAAAGAKKRKAAKKTAAGRAEPEAIAGAVVEAHAAGTLSLVVCNTVRAAQAVFRALPGDVPRVLLTSRFRADDRAAGEEALQRFEEARKAAGGVVAGSPGLICVSTQVVEAGVDISARRLWSEVAPWASIVQRLGRLNRDGRDNEGAEAVFFPAFDDAEAQEKGRVGPYSREAIGAAEQLLAALAPLSQRMPARMALAEVQGGKLGRLVDQALAAPPAPLPRAVDVHGLFSTERDVYGGFTDVSPFVRDADPNADVSVFWRDFKAPLRDDAAQGPAFDPREACPVPVHALRAFLDSTEAYVWDPDARRWQKTTARALRPGMVVMLAGWTGGYRRDLGWTGNAADRLIGLEPPGPGAGAYDDDRRSQSIQGWVTLNVHLSDAEREAAALVGALALPEELAQAVTRAAGEHDIGKAHPQWQGSLGKPEGDATLWAKFRAPAASAAPFRPGMRHEAASALAMMHRLACGEADFPALSVYIAAAHHGKVRTHLRARGREGDDVCGVPRGSDPLPLNGGMPLDFRCAADGADGMFTDEGFTLESPGWTGIVSDLLGPPRPGRPWDTGSVPAGEPRNLGPFRLAYLEALVRIADWRASRAPSEVHHEP
ncbi:MAG: hypothetical protein IT382_04740 [Deltaproteobacteria bacterium]|nr:hypothetical protein [Deltaproteobacteria bacterium]